MRYLCDAAKMSSDVATIPFQAHANYGTWSIDFDVELQPKNNSHFGGTNNICFGFYYSA